MRVFSLLALNQGIIFFLARELLLLEPQNCKPTYLLELIVFVLFFKLKMDLCCYMTIYACLGLADMYLVSTIFNN